MRGVNEDASSRFPFGDGFEFETCECETEEMVEAAASMVSAGAARVWKTSWRIEVFVDAGVGGNIRYWEYVGGVSNDGGARDRVRVHRVVQGVIV